MSDKDADYEFCGESADSKEENDNLPGFFKKLLNDEEIIFENENVWFISNSWTRMFDRDLAEPDRHGITMSDWRLIIVRRKADNAEVRVFYNPSTGEFGQEVRNAEDASLMIILMKRMLREEADIVTIAETGRFPKII